MKCKKRLTTRRYFTFITKSLCGFLILSGLQSVSFCGGKRSQPSGDSTWEKLEKGLEYGVFHSLGNKNCDTACIHIFRIDPDRFEFRLLNTSASEQGELHSARQWCEKEKLVAAINASMYQTDYRSSVSLMKTRRHINNPRLSKDKTVLVFDRLDKGVPKVQIIDRECDDFDALKEKYATQVQSIRMISCKGKNVWSPNQEPWSVAAIGVDRKGRILFIHVTTPHTVHALINSLQALSIGIERAMYVEGGSEAQLYVQSGDRTYEFAGMFTGGGIPMEASAIPNVIGVVRRTEK